MSLRVKHLNADTSWLLVFSPPCAGADPSPAFLGTFTVLIDPWLSGPSKIWASKFSLSHHTVPACVESLDELPEPDVVVVSQDKSDHCNEATLRQLSPTARSLVVGPAAAARKIRSWRHFDPARVHTLRRHDASRPAEGVLRIAVPAFSSVGQPGEVTISLVASKVDLTGLHNAIGITYRPPSSPLSHTTSASFFVPGGGSGGSSSNSSNSSFGSDTHTMLDGTGTGSNTGTATGIGSGIGVAMPITPPPTPPLAAEGKKAYPASLASTVSSTRSVGGQSITLVPSSCSTAGERLAREKALSVIYSPHGLDYGVIRPWAASHLVAEAALPLTALFHCFNRATVPWYMGGSVAHGFEKGLETAQALYARTLISAHDEDKECSGISTLNLKVERHAPEQVRRELGLREGAAGTSTSHSTEVVEIGVGQDYLIRGK